MTTEIVERQNNAPQAADQSPMAMMTLAMAQGADLGQLEKMMELQIRWEGNEAKKAYVKAMAAFKADPPKINKDRKVSFNKTNYSHASLGNVTEKINSGLGEHGLSAAWATEQNGTSIKVTCTITHMLGHSESTSLVAPADTSGAKNGIQAIGSTISYLQRYTILALTGLATQDQDDDGVQAGGQDNIPKQIIIGQDNINWLSRFCKTHDIKDKKILMSKYRFDPYGTTAEQFEPIKRTMESDYQEAAA